MLQLASDMLAYLLLGGLLYELFFFDTQERFFALVFGTILFPESVLFMQKPSVSPQLLFLYGFFLAEFARNPSRFKRDFFEFPLKIVLLLILLARSGTEFYNGNTSLKGIFAIAWNYINLYGYLFAAFIAGKRTSVEHFARQFLVPLAVMCLLIAFEALFVVNLPYQVIAAAFPINDGIYTAGVAAHDSWRVRAFFTTKHPTTLGTLLMSLFVFYWGLLQLRQNRNFRIIAILCLLAVAMFMCGSRTAMACAALGVALFFYRSVPAILKVCIIGVFAYACYFSVGYVYNMLDEAGKGSSMSLRLDQLYFSFTQWQKSPVWGNGQGYIGKEIMERNAYGDRVFNHEIGGLESIVFKMMIENGAVGLLTYYLLFVYLAVWFLVRHRKSPHAFTGFVITVVSAAFFSLSGHIGNNTAFSFILMGFLLGAEVKGKQLAKVEELTLAGRSEAENSAEKGESGAEPVPGFSPKS